MDEWRYQRDLKLDLLRDAARAWQAKVAIRSRARVSCVYGFNQRRALQGPLARFAPPFDSGFGQPRLAEMMR